MCSSDLGRFDTVRARPVSRLGYLDYAVVNESFEIKRPTWPLESEQKATRAA